MAFNPLKHAFDDDGKPTPALNGFLDNALKVQRPVVLRWVKRLRAEHPDETPEQIAKRLERMYVRANTATGGVAGGAAMIPGIGTLASLGVSTVSVGGYLEMTALYAQAIAELHGVHTSDPVRTRSMVMALMLGEDGGVLMKQVLASSSKSRGLTNRWGLMMGTGSKEGGLDVGKKLRNMFVRRFIRKQSTAALGRALPFGIGAVVGGGANLAMSRAVVKSTQEAFGPLPASFPPELSEVDRAPKLADDARDRSKDSEEAGEPAQVSGEGQQDS
ncbi:di- and tripeptidase [Kocuria palustris]|nr:di- and tripeptidase [Kocuria palustris]MBN6758313.1 di- and tripeptidase [Kocuria palustris]MBN6763401.1 di- and tripeptidase [Kocuria palustris]MBN6782757.1 di- and tripeptidase [Kocuria palustris]MBN6799187.1 di- and tripeptidase [Kocuria palustris]